MVVIVGFRREKRLLLKPLFDEACRMILRALANAKS